VPEIAAPSVSGPNARAAEAAERTLKRKPKPPSDFSDAEEFLRYVRETFDKDKEADDQNRREMIEDARFVAGEQWESQIRTARDAKNKPTLTINRLPAYVAQLVGNRRLNDTGIKIIPDAGGTKKIAELREGLVRSIQKNSRAQHVYDTAFQQQVIGGLGNFQIHLDYAHDDVFEQDIRIVAISNVLSVVWDRTSVEPSGADAEHVFVTDKIPRKDFEKRYPKAVATDFDGMASEVRGHGWDTQEAVQVVSFWRMRSRERTVALMQNGDVQDVTDMELDDWWDGAAQDANGFPMVREVQRKYAEMYLCTSTDILAGPYELPIQRVPVFKVTGWELFIEGDRKRWGLIRFLRDPQKLHNYWRSTIAEKLVGSPKAKWIAASSAVEGREDQWRNSHLSDDPLLIYNAESGAAPDRVNPVQMEAALIQEAGIASQDIRDVSNIHEANLGQKSNEVSGRAIMARQRVGEVGTVIYQDNLNIAIEEAGKVINQLIPFVYDSPRIIKVLGTDMQSEELVQINDPANPESDITVGKYAVAITTGPSYTTRRVEAREEMMAMVNAMPDTMRVAADKIVEAQDWPGADEIAQRLRTQLPPNMVSPEDMSEEEQQAMAQQAEQAQMQQQIEMQKLQLDMMLTQAKIAEANARAAEANARAEQAMSSVPRNLAGAQQAQAAAAKNIADIEQGEVQTALNVVDRLDPAGNGAL
jgi:hypothetical protein